MQVVALHDITSQRFEPRHLAAGLHSFRHHRQVQAVSQRDNSLHNRSSARASAIQFAHERLVDLDRIDRQVLQAMQRRVPGSEIVDRRSTS